MAAKKGNKYACAGLADIFITGNDRRIEPDFPVGIKWLRKAAELGHVRSMHNLGNQIIEGQVKGVKPEEGVKWFIKAAENGYAPAQTNLGTMYINGVLVGQDFPKAMAPMNIFGMAELLETVLILARFSKVSVWPDIKGMIG